MIFFSIIVFIVILAVLVLVHEFGHFIVAKKSGMQIDEFGIGFPPRLWGIKRGETIYSVNALPLGGFVRIAGENNDDQENPRSFVNKSFGKRLGVLVAGVLMNVILAWVLLSIGLMGGLPTEIDQGDAVPAHARLTNQSLAVLDVSTGSPADAAGIETGDSIIAVDGTKVSSADQFSQYVKSHAGKQIAFTLSYNGKGSFIKDATPRLNPPAGQAPLGVAIGEIGILSYPWYYAPVIGFKATGVLIAETAEGFYYLVTGKLGFSSVGGPIRIAALTNQVTKLGLQYVIQFAATLSINLAVINIVPFPALDGGRVLFLFIEKIRGKKNNQQWEGYANSVGFMLLLLLILVISIRDVTVLIKH